MDNFEQRQMNAPHEATPSPGLQRYNALFCHRPSAHEANVLEMFCRLDPQAEGSIVLYEDAAALEAEYQKMREALQKLVGDVVAFAANHADNFDTDDQCRIDIELLAASAAVARYALSSRNRTPSVPSISDGEGENG